jgi:hypothetical protein
LAGNLQSAIIGRRREDVQMVGGSCNNLGRDRP